MTPLATLCWLGNIIFDTIGQLAFKAAADTPDDLSHLERWLHMLKDRWIWLGLTAYLVEILCWIAFLSLVPLSLAVLVGSANILAVMVGGRLFFAEALTPRRLTATVLISVGVIMVGWV